MLPEIAVPTHTLKLPSSGEEITYRPFLIKEEKIILMALESGDDEELSMAKATKDIIKSCVQTDINVDKLPTFDVEFIFLQLRSRSKGEEINLNMRCGRCEAENQVNIKLDDITVVHDEKHTKKIKINETVGMMMKYPTYTSLIEEQQEDSNTNKVFKSIINTIDYIYDGETIHKAEDQTDDQLLDFLDTLDSEIFVKINEFFDTSPELKKNIKFKCNKCKHENELLLKGARNFLG